MPIGGATTFAEIRRHHFEQFAARLGANPRATARLIERYAETIEEAAAVLYGELEAMPVPEPLVRESQLRVLRSIQFAVIRDMVPRLRA